VSAVIAQFARHVVVAA